MLPISDILIRSVSGYVFIVPALILYFLYLKKVGRKQNILHITAVFLFCYYLFGILTVTGIGYTSTMSFRPRISLIPFVDMISGPIDTMLNVVLFVPFGFFLPLLYKKYHHIKTVALTGFLFSLSVEIVQMFGWGATDINDLITNTIGACLGYFVYYLLSKAFPNNLRKQLQSKSINDILEVLLLAIYTFAVMVTIQPWVIHSLLNIG
jgi:glycopeptide antibiotics resistance protein